MRPRIVAKTWAYGTQRKGTVIMARWRPLTLSPKSESGQFIVDDHNEGHICVGDCADWTAKAGDQGTLTYTEGGPTGGYWKFVKDEERTT